MIPEVKMTVDFLISGLFIVLGLMLSIFTQFSIKIIVIALGAAAVVKGLYDLAKVKKLSKDAGFNRMVLIRSLAGILVGLLAFFLPLAFFRTAETVVKVMLYLLAIFLMISGVLQLFLVAKLNQEEVPAPTKPMKIEAVSYFLVAIFLFLVASINITGIIRIVGILLVIVGVIYCIYLWHNRTLVINPDSVEDEPEDAEQDNSVQFEQIEDNSSDEEE